MSDLDFCLTTFRIDAHKCWKRVLTLCDDIFNATYNGDDINIAHFPEDSNRV